MQQAAEVGVSVEDDAEEVEDLALLELALRQTGVSEGRWTLASRSCVRMRRTTGPCFFFDRVEVIDDFEGAGTRWLCAVSSTSCSTPSMSLRSLTFSVVSLARPVDAGNVGAEVEAQAGGIAQIEGHGDGVRGVDAQRVLAPTGWGWQPTPGGSRGRRLRVRI